MRAPDITIGQDYLERWYIIPRNRFLNIYLHKFSGSDDDRALHDHPWHSVSFLLKGKLVEVTQPGGTGQPFHWCDVRRLLPVFRRATHAHRLVLREGPAWTLFITGPKIREWGFWCRTGWHHWTTMATEDGRMVGGCNQ